MLQTTAHSLVWWSTSDALPPPLRPHRRDPDPRARHHLPAAPATLPAALRLLAVHRDLGRHRSWSRGPRDDGPRPSRGRAGSRLRDELLVDGCGWGTIVSVGRPE